MYEKNLLLFNAQKITQSVMTGKESQARSKMVAKAGKDKRAKYHVSNCNYSYHIADNCFMLNAATLCDDAQIKTPARRLA